MNTMKEKTAIVTGASRGIGRAIATRMAANGFNIVVNYASNESAALDLVNCIEQSGGNAIAVQANVADPKSVIRLFDIAIQTFGRVNILINNAGKMKLSTIAKSNDEYFNTQIATNLKGSFNTMREAANYLDNGGSIINLSTSVVGMNLESYGIYAATKAAIETMTKILSKELRGRNITVNAVAPGPTATELFFSGKPPEVIEHLEKMAPLERLGTPEDIANTVSFLASTDGHWINGQVLRANGGIV